jgi:hypothetical protein
VRAFSSREFGNDCVQLTAKEESSKVDVSCTSSNDVRNGERTDFAWLDPALCGIGELGLAEDDVLLLFKSRKGGNEE